MSDTGKTYLCIDLKSFYASVECAARGLDPFTTNLVVADPSRSDKTICLAITPAMKALGIPNRCRLFQIPAGVNYLIAKPRMRRYMEVSADIYAIYLRYISPEDIHVYSIDECFIDATPYLALYAKTPRELARMLMDAVFAETGICATAGIGTNLFLAKVALDITAKHVADHIGELDEASFRRSIWHHRPITDIWNIGPGIAARLAHYGVHDLQGVCGLREETLYREFGVNAEYLIDHAHGIEPCTIAEIQAYKPKANSLCVSQVLQRDYRFEEARLLVCEMADAVALQMVERQVVGKTFSLRVNYARKEKGFDELFSGEHGVQNRWRAFAHSGAARTLGGHTNSRAKLLETFLSIYDDTTDHAGAIRHLSLGVGGVLPEEFAELDLFANEEALASERALAQAVLAVKGKFGKNALVRGVSLREGATGRERNEQIGGHHA